MNIQTARQHPIVGAEHKWCSAQKTASRDDTDCYKQGAPRPPQSGRAHTASAVQGATTRPNDDEKPSPNFDDGFEEGFAFAGLLAGSGNRGFHPNGSGNRGFHPNSNKFTMLVDSGASDHLIDEELIPRLRKSMRDYKKVNDPKTIMTNGNKKLFAAATGTIWGYIIDQAGKRVRVRISVMFVPGLGRNVFSSIKAMQSGVSTILETGNPLLQFDSSTSLPLTQHPEDKGVCSYNVFPCTLGDTADASSTLAVVPAAQASNDANGCVCTVEEMQEFCTNSSIAMEHTTTVTPQRKRVSAWYGQNYANQKECTPSGGNNTPEEATGTEAERQDEQIPGKPEKAIVTETEPGRFCALVQVMLHYYENNLLEEEKLSTTTEASSSPKIGESSSRAGALPQKVGVFLTGITPAITPGDAHPTTTWAAPDVPHHETASTRPNPRVEDTFDNTHATGAQGTTPPTTCVNFTCTERDPFRISEEENRVTKVSNDILRRHPLPRSASPGITGTGITGAGISKASSHGIFGATRSGYHRTSEQLHLGSLD